MAVKKLPYGITGAGRQWAVVFENWLMENTGFDRIAGVSQLFARGGQQRVLF